MLLIEAYVDRSEIEGLGLFARRPIPRGTLVWSLDLRFDRLVERTDYEAATGAVFDHLERYTYPYRRDPRYLLMEVDNARFMNHSDDPNCDVSDPDATYAIRDIAEGEEITCHYGQLFDGDFELLPAR